MMQRSEKRLSVYVTDLMMSGRYAFLRDEAIQALGVSRGAFLDAAERLQHRKHLVSPRQGFYVVVPPQYISWGAPPPAWYIDDLMRFEGRPYYVGLLKAAELHGASHHAVMEFQVVTNNRLRQIRVGRSVVTFHQRQDIEKVASGIEQRKTDTGFMKISSAELTALDLLRYPQSSGGLDNILTVLNDLSDHIDGDRLAKLSKSFEKSTVQRLGYLLDGLQRKHLSDLLNAAISTKRPLIAVELESSDTRKKDFKLPIVERNKRWGVIVRRLPEVEQ